MTRLQQLQERIEEPLLVTAPVNVRYLTGFDSSNAALLVEQGRARLFSDFRYAEAGKRVPDVEFSVTTRNLYGSLAEELSGRLAFEADAVTYAAYQALEAGGLELVPRRGVVEALRAVKDEDELALIRRAGEITSEAFTRLAEEPFVGRTEKEVAWRLDSLYHELGADGPSFPTIVAAGRTARRRTRTPATTGCRGDDGGDRLGRRARRVRVRLHAHVRNRRASGGAGARVRRDRRARGRGWMRCVRG